MSGDQDTAGSKLTIGSSDPRIIYHNRTMAGGTRVQVWDKGLLWEGYGPTVTYATTTDNRGWAEFVRAIPVSISIHILTDDHSIQFPCPS